MLLFMKGVQTMDIASVTQLIGSLGFPIVACIAMYITLNKQSEQHKEEMNKITESLNNNTIAITKLTERLTFNHIGDEEHG